MTVRQRDIFDAVAKGDPRLVRAIAMTGADLDARTPGGRSVLQVAVANGNAAVLNTLIELGCDVREKDSNTEINLLEWLLYINWPRRNGDIIPNNMYLSEREVEMVLILVREGLEIGDSMFLDNARGQAPELFLQAEELMMNCRNLQAADEGLAAPTGYEFDI